jgi:hypothetical protein
MCYSEPSDNLASRTGAKGEKIVDWQFGSGKRPAEGCIELA